MGRLNEIQKDIKISYGNNTIELHIEDDGIHISTGNKQIIIDSDVRRESDKPFKSNSLIIKQDLDDVDVKVEEHIEEAEEKFEEIDESIDSIQQQTEQTGEKLSEHIIDNIESFNTIASDINSTKEIAGAAISKTNELENNISGIENDIENLNSTAISLQDDINTVSGDISHVKTEINVVKKDVNKNTLKISQTNDKLSGHIVSNDKEFTDINKKIDNITDSTRGIQTAKKAYDILAERYRILLNERKNAPQKPTHTPKQRVIKKVGWELILQKAYQELWEEGNKYPSKYEVLQRAYLIEGYDINTASKLASYDIGGYPVDNVFINSFADC